VTEFTSTRGPQVLKKVAIAPFPKGMPGHV
jgi:hypothetical protein